ncbi:hypothetical protein MBM_01843 [Drepanopeziza brunnea f. sp. 'multigermtubi' MB_m1]|uniref:Uncharacterized protein n=1 Tax=Marssonina brunnea f. sp. multigermtubi (strain MB_m1) TaxID=1072389 RepID=K1X3S6_MARBU|nr:uncharacterized protein MBM_01843 [Drepanopeziza brunnea f. sp. 'multigermtubi' MB_m1]EKD19891.1 hypothetical protein MBM_01843 [Drepanopeziza brunnea f. sp. 'multigermtubi' MB_m1]
MDSRVSCNQAERAATGILEKNGSAFGWADIHPGTDLEDPRLSISSAPRDRLPRKLYIIGCEFDLLCGDAEILAKRLASDGTAQRVGTDDIWEHNGVK